MDKPIAKRGICDRESSGNQKVPVTRWGFGQLITCELVSSPRVPFQQVWSGFCQVREKQTGDPNLHQGSYASSFASRFCISLYRALHQVLCLTVLQAILYLALRLCSEKIIQKRRWPAITPKLALKWLVFLYTKNLVWLATI
jgi:hypothetical protein